MFHKEGFNIIILFFIVVSMDVIILEVLFEEPSTIKSLLQTSALILLLFILWFFRNPKRNINKKIRKKFKDKAQGYCFMLRWILTLLDLEIQLKSQK